MIIEQFSFAAWTGNPAGSADCGMESCTPSSSQWYGSSSGYDLNPMENPGLTFDLEISPSASASLDEDSESDLTEADAEVSYTVKTYPVWIELDGVLDPGSSPKALIGHAIKATVKTSDLPITLSSYAWTIGGSGKFESYSVSTSSATLDLTYPTDQSSVTVAFAKPSDGVNFDCLVTVSNPPGFPSFTVKSKPVDIKTTTSQAFYFGKGAMDIAQIGNWYFGPNGAQVLLPNDPAYGGNRGEVATVGVYWRASVDIPSAFYTKNNGLPENSRSKVLYVNTLKKVYRRVQLDSGTWNAFPGNFAADPGPPLLRKLDKAFPYKELSSSGVFFAKPSFKQIEGDSPFIIVVTSEHQKVEMDDDNEVFLMFKPYDNGIASYYVPLSSQDWNPEGSATQSGSSWYVDSGHAITLGTQGDYPTHPSWTSTVSGGTWP